MDILYNNIGVSLVLSSTTLIESIAVHYFPRIDVKSEYIFVLNGKCHVK